MRVTLLAAAAALTIFLPAPDPDNGITRAPYVQKVTDSSASIMWRTSKFEPSEVWIGFLPDALTKKHRGYPGTKHLVTIEGLEPGQRYYYALDPESGNDGQFFDTAGGSSIRIWALGDSGDGPPHATDVRDAFYGFNGGPHIDAIITMGDNAYRTGLDSAYQEKFFDVFEDSLTTSPAYVSRGNHDNHKDVIEDSFDLPGNEIFYSFDIGDVHLICLETFYEDANPGSEQYDWLKADLLANQTATWTIVYSHVPPYTKGTHDSDTEIWAIDTRTHLVPLFDEYGVDLVLGGHSHNYERSYFMSGHYGDSDSFDPATHIVDPSDGKFVPYLVEDNGPFAGAVYVVAGSSSKNGSGPFDHEAMMKGFSAWGSLVIDIRGSLMRVRFLDDAGVVLDDFSMRAINTALYK